MKNQEFSFIILTLNEEKHLPRLIQSISALNASTYVLDSGSTDRTVDICSQHQIPVQQHPFENHPKQWNIALNAFEIQTPWVICLDADQIISEELFNKLEVFRDSDHPAVDGIYFNRKNYFKGNWIRFGGYYPKYLLKMFRYERGYSDLQENMDHRFQVPGKTLIWKTGHLIEENLKENEISFWISKHNRYSGQLAAEAFLKQHPEKTRYKYPKPWGSPNERKALQKKLWMQLPLYIRPLLYFIYRMCFQLGILDGRQGILFHFLHSFWFRLIVDIKISEIRSRQASPISHTKTGIFLFRFLAVFTLIYGFHLAYIGITTPGGIYLDFVNRHLNYIPHWRNFHLHTTTAILEQLGYQVSIKTNNLHVENQSGFKLVYSCLGYGTMSAFTAFVLAFPKRWQSKLPFLVFGLLIIQAFNIIRLALIALYYKPGTQIIDHHLCYNITIYSFIAFSIYLWTKNRPAQHVSTTQKKFR